MRVEVLNVRQSGKSFNVAHVLLHGRVGSCLAAPDVVVPGEYELKSTLRLNAGRWESLIRVERIK